MNKPYIPQAFKKFEARIVSKFEKERDNFLASYYTEIEEYEKAIQEYETAMREYKKAMQEYNMEVEEYNRLTHIGKFFRGPLDIDPPEKPMVEKPTKPIKPDIPSFDMIIFEGEEFAQVGQRFALQYCDIVGAITTINEEYSTITTGRDSYISNHFRYPKDELLADCHELDQIARLWTVVEYIGNGQYLDLVSGMVFQMPRRKEKVLDTVTQETEAQALAEKEEILRHPLCIKSKEVTITDRRLSYEHRGRTIHYADDCPHYYEEALSDELFPLLEELTPVIKKHILDETVPRKEEIKSILSKMEVLAVTKIEEFYKTINRIKLDEYYNEAMAQSETIRRQEEINERKRKEAAEKRRQEAERRKRAQAEREWEEVGQFTIDDDFAAIFGVETISDASEVLPSPNMRDESSGDITVNPHNMGKHK